MPAPMEVSDCLGKAVVWPFVGRLANGEVVVGEPYELPVRWVRKTTSMLSGEGVNTTVEAQVVLGATHALGYPLVTEDSLMWEGELADLQGTGSTGPQQGEGMRVVAANLSPSHRYMTYEHRRTVGLQYYKGRFPPTVVNT